uniref:Transcription initiation factor TFIID subunit 8 n=1 Tax=Rhizophora mucronata TaxID=61149 RepID=A0A2P2J471_RHIMU
MSHGGGESGIVPGKTHVAKRKFVASGDEFAQGIAKIAVAQICESAGFQTFQHSALETLSDVTVRYIHSIGKNAQFYANLAGRTEVNALDIIQGLEELGLAQGFASASDIEHCLSGSGALREIVQYVSDAENIPFAYSIPSFPIIRERKRAPSFLCIGEEPSGEHIPAWLPAFPDSQTYLMLPTSDAEDLDSTIKKVEPSRQERKMDKSPFNLQQQFNCNGAEGPSSLAPSTSGKAKYIAQSNPFLSAPLQFRDKEVSLVFPPAKLANEAAVRNLVEQNNIVDNPVSVLQTFAPAIEALKTNLSHSEEGQKILLNQRPLVQFKIGSGKKSSSPALCFTRQKKGVETMFQCSANDNEKDDKKWKAEEILKQSIENPGELAQL